MAVTLLERAAPTLLALDDIEEMVEHLRRGVPRLPRHTLQDLLTQALG